MPNIETLIKTGHAIDCWPLATEVASTIEGVSVKRSLSGAVDEADPFEGANATDVAFAIEVLRNQQAFYRADADKAQAEACRLQNIAYDSFDFTDMDTHLVELLSDENMKASRRLWDHAGRMRLQAKPRVTAVL